MKRYISVIVILLCVLFTANGQSRGKKWGDKIRRSDLIRIYNCQDNFAMRSLELRKDSFFYRQRYWPLDDRKGHTYEEKGVWIKKGDTIQCVNIYEKKLIVQAIAGNYLICPQGLIELISSKRPSCVYKNASAPVHFTERTMPNIEFSWSRSTDIRGTVYTGDSADVFLGAYIRLMLEIDSVLYTSNIEAYTDIDNNFYIFYPDYLRQSPNIKKLLMIERIGFQRQFVNIDSIGHKGVLSVTLQPQSAFPTIHIRKGEYHIDLSPLASEGWKLPAPKDGFHDFYESICSILQKSGQKDMALHLKFSKGGVLEDIKGEDTYGGITFYLNELKWEPAKVYNGKKIPVDLLLNVVVERDN